jgi:hypothetical protein
MSITGETILAEMKRKKGIIGLVNEKCANIEWSGGDVVHVLLSAVVKS